METALRNQRENLKNKNFSDKIIDEYEALMKAEMTSCNNTVSIIDGLLFKSRVKLENPTIESIVDHLKQNENGIVHIGF